MNQKHMDEISWLDVSSLIPQAVPSERMLGMSELVPEFGVERSKEEPPPLLDPIPAEQTPAAQPLQELPVPDHFPFPNVLILFQ